MTVKTIQHCSLCEVHFQRARTTRAFATLGLVMDAAAIALGATAMPWSDWLILTAFIGAAMVATLALIIRVDRRVRRFVVARTAHSLEEHPADTSIGKNSL